VQLPGDAQDTASTCEGVFSRPGMMVAWLPGTALEDRDERPRVAAAAAVAADPPGATASASKTLMPAKPARAR